MCMALAKARSHYPDPGWQLLKHGGLHPSNDRVLRLMAVTSPRSVQIYAVAASAIYARQPP
ncbi:hypothetical protein ACVWXO_002936 [Bradyrhizobium sp. LM2.7]